MTSAPCRTDFEVGFSPWGRSLDIILKAINSTTNPDGSIAAYADSCFQADAEDNCSCLTTEREIVRAYDGKPYFADEAPEKPDEIVRQERATAFEVEIAKRLADFARDRGWDGIDRALVQTGLFADDARQAQVAYDATWEAAFELLPDVEGGTLSVEDAVAQLPALTWPEPE
jgi:hypothetical protein